MSLASRTASWSMLSGLSLSEVSHIGTQVNPMNASDITKKDAYSFTPPDSRTTLRRLRSLLLCQFLTRPRVMEACKEAHCAKSLRVFDSRPKNQPLPPAMTTVSAADTVYQMSFGAALVGSVHHANVPISLLDENGKNHIYGYIPFIIVTWDKRPSAGWTVRAGPFA